MERLRGEFTWEQSRPSPGVTHTHSHAHTVSIQTIQWTVSKQTRNTNTLVHPLKLKRRSLRLLFPCVCLEGLAQYSLSGSSTGCLLDGRLFPSTAAVSQSVSLKDKRSGSPRLRSLRLSDAAALTHTPNTHTQTLTLTHTHTLLSLLSSAEFTYIPA